jgi:hypothetical protein
MIICVVIVYVIPYGDMTFASGSVLISPLSARGRISVDVVVFHWVVELVQTEDNVNDW